jgi:hypothetical protein
MMIQAAVFNCHTPFSPVAVRLAKYYPFQSAFPLAGCGGAVTAYASADPRSLAWVLIGGLLDDRPNV